MTPRQETELLVEVILDMIPPNAESSILELGVGCGNIIALSYATLLHYGYEGYKRKAQEIVLTLKHMKDEIKTIKDIQIIGNPEICVIGLRSTTLDIYQISREMKERGWSLNNLQFV